MLGILATIGCERENVIFIDSNAKADVGARGFFKKKRGCEKTISHFFHRPFTYGTGIGLGSFYCFRQSYYIELKMTGVGLWLDFEVTQS